MFMNGAIDELLWFLSGSTNAYDLPERSQKWWTPWAREDGALGPIYSEQYRKARWWFEVEPRIFEAPDVVKQDGLLCGVGVPGTERWSTAKGKGLSAEEVLLKAAWRDMLRRCYDENSNGFKAYGAIGVHVSPEWLSFDNFSRDAKRLQGWHLKLEYPEEYSLDKDILCASNRYSKETCIWASHQEQSINTSTGTPFYGVSPSGDEVFFPSFGEALRERGLNIGAVHRALNGKLKTHHGWSNFRYATPSPGKTIRFREVDQLKRLIAGVKHDPDGRRHLINLWNTPAMEHTALPCCHGSVIQFYVSDGKLSCQMYQRSADLFIGVPVNIASYALLTHMVAQVCGLGVGDFIHTFGDAHIYDNHIEQVEEQLSREPFPLPTLQLNPDVKDIFSFTAKDVVVVGYQHHPAITAEVAV
jgi:thymidylate synthase